MQAHGKLAWINRNEKSFKKINLILLKPVPKCLRLILTLWEAFLMACCSVTGSVGFCFLFLIRRCFPVTDTLFSLCATECHKRENES